ncbi:MAG TPA: hypothetical protein VJ841_03470 [Candidatus Saccharimonadales bacterium]|nr:hypothetical protein [Candidatus Saccharimonadales bacterium]
MSNYISQHQWVNGDTVTVEKKDDDISIRIQGENENMLWDIVVGEYEAMCIAHSLLSVLTNGGSSAS